MTLLHVPPLLGLTSVMPPVLMCLLPILQERDVLLGVLRVMSAMRMISMRMIRVVPVIMLPVVGVTRLLSKTSRLVFMPVVTVMTMPVLVPVRVAVFVVTVRMAVFASMTMSAFVLCAVFTTSSVLNKRGIFLGIVVMVVSVPVPMLVVGFGALGGRKFDFFSFGDRLGFHCECYNLVMMFRI
jgi:hypothetical protein